MLLDNMDADIGRHQAARATTETDQERAIRRVQEAERQLQYERAVQRDAAIQQRIKDEQIKSAPGKVHPMIPMQRSPSPLEEYLRNAKRGGPFDVDQFKKWMDGYD